MPELSESIPGRGRKIGVSGIIKIVNKVWGREEWIVNNELYCLKKLYITPGGCCSLHYHPVKDETFVSGVGLCHLLLDGVLHTVGKSCQTEVYRIRPLVRHRFWVPRDWEECVITEVSTHHLDLDVVRLEESRLLRSGEMPLAGVEEERK